MNQIELNPKACIKYIAEDKIAVKLDDKITTLSGKLTNRYFIRNLKYYISPIEVGCLYKKIFEVGKDNEYDINDFTTVINMLIEKSIIIVRLNTEKKIHCPIIIDLLDYTNQSAGNIINSMIERFIIDNNYKPFVECKTFNMLDDDYCPNEALQKKRIAVPIFWSADIIEVDRLSKNDYIDELLPVVCNYSYFSVGPKICDIISMKKAKKALIKEMPRYSYINCEPSEEYLYIMSSYLLQQIHYYFYELNDSRPRSRINDEMITYNFNAYTLDVRKYVGFDI